MNILRSLSICFFLKHGCHQYLNIFCFSGGTIKCPPANSRDPLWACYMTVFIRETSICDLVNACSEFQRRTKGVGMECEWKSTVSSDHGNIPFTHYYWSCFVRFSLWKGSVGKEGNYYDVAILFVDFISFGSHSNPVGWVALWLP